MTQAYNPASLFLSPTLVIGLGGTGVEIVRLVKARVRESRTPMPEIIGFLAFDTEPCPNLPGEERLSQREFGYLGDYNASHVLDNLTAHPHIQDWWMSSSSIISGMVHKGARQKRPVGRLSLYVRWGVFTQKLEARARKIREIRLKEAEQRGGIEVERATGRSQVYVVASVCGGTGSGVLLDAAFRVRQELGDDADIVGVLLLPSCFLPEISSTIQQRRICANAYATLRELNYFLAGKRFDSCFPEHPYMDPEGRKLTRPLYRPFDSLYLVDRSNGREYLSSLSDIRRMAAQQIFLDILTPLGKRLASRQSNLRDLAAERTSETSTSAAQPLAVAGFATASLILPTTDILSLASTEAAAALIRKRVIGRPLVLNDERELALELDSRFELLIGAFLPRAASKSADRSQSIRERLLATAGTSAPDSLPPIPSDALQKVLTDLGLQLASDFERWGFRGITYAARVLANHIDARLKALDEDVQRFQADVVQAEQALKTPRPAENNLVNVVNAVASILPGATPQADRIRRWQTLIAEARQRRDTTQAQLNRVEHVKQALAQVLLGLKDVSKEAEHRIEVFEYMAQQFELASNGSKDGNADILDGVGAETGVQIFDLATFVGRDRYPVTNNGHTELESFLSSHSHTLSVNQELTPAEEDSLLKDLADQGLFHLVTQVTASELAVLTFVPMPKRMDETVREKLTHFFTDRFREKGAEHTGLRIVEFLDWFYKHVTYNKGISRRTPIDPIPMMFYRCERPFLEIDEARLGTDGAANTEDVSLLGLDKDRAVDGLAADMLDEFETFEDVQTGVPERLDLSRSRHGYPISILRDLNRFRDDYNHFLTKPGEALHIHRDWPANPAMQDLLDPSAPLIPVQPISEPGPASPSSVDVSGRGGMMPTGTSDLRSASGDNAHGAPAAAVPQATRLRVPPPPMPRGAGWTSPRAPDAGPSPEVSAPPPPSIPVTTPPDGTTPPVVSDDRTADTRSASAATEQRLHIDAGSIELISASATDAGRQRDRNEDSIHASDGSVAMAGGTVRPGIFIVADGMPGHDSGEIASTLAVQTISQRLQTLVAEGAGIEEILLDPTRGSDIVRQAILEANEQIVVAARDRHSDMGTTVTLALVLGSQAIIGNLGDSRTYLWRQDVLRQITHDHSRVAQDVEQNIPSVDKARHHPNRNVLIRSLGDPNLTPLQIDIFPVELQARDRLILCSDGLWEMVEDVDIAQILRDTPDPKVTVEALVMRANQNGGADNISVIVVSIASPVGTANPTVQDLAPAALADPIVDAIRRRFPDVVDVGISRAPDGTGTYTVRFESLVIAFRVNDEGLHDFAYGMESPTTRVTRTLPVRRHQDEAVVQQIELIRDQAASFGLRV
jgi:serine/threonine protein phosphatase PrpC